MATDVTDAVAFVTQTGGDGGGFVLPQRSDGGEFVLSMFLHQPVPFKYICGYSLPQEHVMRDPMQSACGHRFCRRCLQTIQAPSSSCSSEQGREQGVQGCPVCLAEAEEEKKNAGNGTSLSAGSSLETDCLEDSGCSPLKQSFADNAIRKEILALRVRCVHTGCSWTNQPLKEFDIHNKTCVKRLVQCPSCSLWIPTDQFPTHNETHKTTEENKCPFSCGLVVSSSDLKKHLTQYQAEHLVVLHKHMTLLSETIGLDRTLAPSPSAALSIQQSSKWRETIANRLCLIEENLKSLQTKELLSQELLSPSIKVNKSKVSNQEVISRVVGCGEVMGKTECDGSSLVVAGADIAGDVQVRLEKLEETLKMLQDVSSIVSNEVTRLYGNVDVLEHLLGEQSKRITSSERKMELLEGQNSVKDARIADLEQKVLSLEQTSWDGTLVWKISDLKRRRHEAVHGRVASFYSPPFYTSKTGYKLCARIYLNGDGQGKGSHVSLFFVVMRGQYDAVLSWPFRHKVILSFLNQNGRENTVDAFRPDPNSTSFKRPVTDMNIASGCPKFLPLSELDSSSSGFVRDDTAFIRITIDMDE